MFFNKQSTPGDIYIVDMLTLAMREALKKFPVRPAVIPNLFATNQDRQGVAPQYKRVDLFREECKRTVKTKYKTFINKLLRPYQKSFDELLFAKIEFFRGNQYGNCMERAYAAFFTFLKKAANANGNLEVIALVCSQGSHAFLVYNRDPNDMSKCYICDALNEKIYKYDQPPEDSLWRCFDISNIAVLTPICLLSKNLDVCGYDTSFVEVRNIYEAILNAESESEIDGILLRRNSLQNQKPGA